MPGGGFGWSLFVGRGNFDNRIWDFRDWISLRTELSKLGLCFNADVETVDSDYLWF